MAELLLVVLALLAGAVGGGLAMYQRGFASGRREARTALREEVVNNQEEGEWRP
jgi:hypothetical protein